jgi:MerR family transcriptional regulator, mercuric resistance operon regulatory protein
MPEQYTIGTLAKQAGVNVETIRYYQRRGLVGEPARPLGGIRRYTQAHARRLRFVREAQALGFNLEEVTDLLALEDGRHCREAERLGSRKLAMVRERMAQLRRVEKALTALVDQCHCNTGKVRCPLIAALENDRRPAMPSARKLTI